MISIIKCVPFSNGDVIRKRLLALVSPEGTISKWDRALETNFAKLFAHHVFCKTFHRRRNLRKPYLQNCTRDGIPTTFAV